MTIQNLPVKDPFKPKDTEIFHQRRLDALMAAIAKNPLPSNFFSDTSRQNKPPKNPLEDWVTGSRPPSAPKASAKRTGKTKGRI